MNRSIIIALLLFFAVCISNVYPEPKSWVADNIYTNQVIVQTTTTTIVAADTGTREVRIHNMGSYIVYIGSGTVATTHGYPLDSDKTITLKVQDTIYGIATTTNTVGYVRVE